MLDKNDNHNIIGQPVEPQEKNIDGVRKKQKLVRVIIITIGVVLILLGVILYFV